MSNETTPGPWKAQERADYPTKIRIYGFNGLACSVADVNFKADANLIVEAVNSYNVLKKENERLRAVLQQIVDRDEISCREYENKYPDEPEIEGYALMAYFRFKAKAALGED